MIPRRATLLVCICLVSDCAWGNRLAAEDLVTLRGTQVEQIWAPAGGALVRFRFVDDEINPLNFEVTPDLEQPRTGEPPLRGHFVCLDRWGAPSAAEATRGVPFHGEAPRIVWKTDRPPSREAGKVSAQMSCVLPLAGLRVRRTIDLDEQGSVALVSEQVTNTGSLSRIYNIVQHPSIAAPFLNDGTLVDSNAAAGFVQDGPLPGGDSPRELWPRVKIGDERADLRRFREETGSGARHDVSSFVFGDQETYGWVTACSPQHRLLVGYAWRVANYPWLNIWRYSQEGKPAARGLEFGTTGYHQPFPILVRQGRILNRPLFEPLDADETATKSYLCFLARIPADFAGVASVRLDQKSIVIRERDKDDPRTVEISNNLSLTP
ncbi:MAG: hypothetical protein ACKV0T_06340 [Planctomycetales bacterium]